MRRLISNSLRTLGLFLENLQIRNPKMSEHQYVLSLIWLHHFLYDYYFLNIEMPMHLSCTASAPVFLHNPVRVIATLGKDVSLECKPRASPKPRITWKRADRRIQQSRRYGSSPEASRFTLQQTLVFIYLCHFDWDDARLPSCTSVSYEPIHFRHAAKDTFLVSQKIVHLSSGFFKADGCSGCSSLLFAPGSTHFITPNCRAHLLFSSKFIETHYCYDHLLLIYYFVF